MVLAAHTMRKKQGKVVLTLSVTNSASATDRRFQQPPACSAQINTPLSSRARWGDLSFCRFTDLRTASVPAFQPAKTFMTCLTQSDLAAFFNFF